MNNILLASSLIASATIATPAHALVNVIGTETGGNVEFSYSGSLNVAGLTPDSTSTGSAIFPSFALLVFGNSSANDSFTSALTGPTSFGIGGNTNASSSSGDIFLFRGFAGGFLTVPNNYISGTSISGSITFNSATFASLGVTPGTYNYNLTNGLDSINLNIGVTPVPFEFSPALGLGVIGGLVAAKKLSGKFLKK